MSNINKIKVSGQTYSIQDENACKVVELTQAQYDALPASAKTSNSLFVITDATAGDLSNYYTKSETDDLLDTKLDASAYTPTDLSNYYTKSETSGATEISTAIASKQDTLVSGTNIKTINNESILGSGNIEIQGGVSESVFTSYSAATDARISEDEEVTAAALNALNDGLSAKQDTLVAGDNITISGNVISAEGGIDSGTVQTMIDGSISGKADTSAVTVAINSAVSGKADSSAVTQEISAAVSGKVDTNAFNTYSAATNARLAEDEEVTAAALNDLNEALSGKADTSSVYTKSEVDTALSGKQDTLVAGDNITISGNVISADGGGKAINAGRGISITTGETADTVSFNLPISAGTNTTSIIVGNTNNTASGSRSFAGGEGCTASSTDSFAFGLANTASSTGATAFGFKTKADVNSSFVCGKWNDIANANTGSNFGDSGNTLFAVGNGWKRNDWTSGTANTHNAIDIRQNGDIYIADTNDTSTTNWYEKPMIKLQDTITATASNTAALGGLKLVKLTQSEYDALSTKDSNTLYVIVN